MDAGTMTVVYKPFILLFMDDIGHFLLFFPFPTLM